MYPLIASLSLWGDRGTTNSNQPDRRTPGQVIDAIAERQGIHQLHQALTDYTMGAKVIRAVDGNGVLMRTEDDSQDRRVSDLYLGSVHSRRQSGPTERRQDTEQRMQVALADLQGVIERLRITRGLLIDVKGSDGTSVVERRGVDPRHVDGWGRY